MVTKSYLFSGGGSRLSNIRLTRNTGREAIGAICAWESEANGTKRDKRIIRLKQLLDEFYSIIL